MPECAAAGRQRRLCTRVGRPELWAWPAHKRAAQLGEPRPLRRQEAPPLAHGTTRQPPTMHRQQRQQPPALPRPWMPDTAARNLGHPALPAPPRAADCRDAGIPAVAAGLRYTQPAAGSGLQACVECRPQRAGGGRARGAPAGRDQASASERRMAGRLMYRRGCWAASAPSSTNSGPGASAGWSSRLLSMKQMCAAATCGAIGPAG